MFFSQGYYSLDTIGNQHFVPNSEVSPTLGLPVYFWVGVVLRNRTVEHNVAALPLLYAGREG